MSGTVKPEPPGAAGILAKISRGLGEAMRGQEIETLDVKLADRGW